MLKSQYERFESLHFAYLQDLYVRGYMVYSAKSSATISECRNILKFATECAAKHMRIKADEFKAQALFEQEFMHTYFESARNLILHSNNVRDHKKAIEILGTMCDKLVNETLKFNQASKQREKTLVNDMRKAHASLIELTQHHPMIKTQTIKGVTVDGDIVGQIYNLGHKCESYEVRNLPPRLLKDSLKHGSLMTKSHDMYETFEDFTTHKKALTHCGLMDKEVDIELLCKVEEEFFRKDNSGDRQDNDTKQYAKERFLENVGLINTLHCHTISCILAANTACATYDECTSIIESNGNFGTLILFEVQKILENRMEKLGEQNDKSTLTPSDMISCHSIQKGQLTVESLSDRSLLTQLENGIPDSDRIYTTNVETQTLPVQTTRPRLPRSQLHHAGAVRALGMMSVPDLIVTGCTIQ